MSKLLVVIGATGNQGGAVLNSFLSDKSFRLRGVTRNVDSDAARKWSEKGVEMVKADIEDEASLEAAFQDASHIFAVTDWFGPFFATGSASQASASETEKGINMARAASKIPTLKHYIWSTLPGANSISQGQHPVPHMDAKATVDDYIRCELPGLLRKTTFMYVGFYGSNLLYPFWLPVLHPKLQTYMWLQPASADIVIPALGNLEVNLGPFVYATAVKSHLTLEGRRVLVSAEELPMKGLLERWGKATGKPTSYVTISGNDFVDMFGAFGEEVKITYDFWASAGFEKSWEIGTVVTREDLGLKAGKELVGWEESMRAINWNEVL